MRKCLVVFLAMVLVLVGTLVMPWHCRVNRAAFERIKEGMTQGEVHAILGGPPGDYRTRPFWRADSGDAATWYAFWCPDDSIEVWEGDEGGILVDYRANAHRQVTGTRFVEPIPYSPGLLERVRWRLAKLWSR